MKNCSKCKYSCKRENDTYSVNGMSADCDLICTYDTKTEVYVGGHMVCGHFDKKGNGGINWSERRKRTFPIERLT